MKKIGRPTKYEPVMCQKAISLMCVGGSKTEVAAELGISRDTFNRWQSENSDFSDAIKRGQELSQAWWERQGRISLRDKEFSYTGWYMNMKNRFGWKDRHEQEIHEHPKKLVRTPEQDAARREALKRYIVGEFANAEQLLGYYTKHSHKK